MEEPLPHLQCLQHIEPLLRTKNINTYIPSRTLLDFFQTWNYPSMPVIYTECPSCCHNFCVVFYTHCCTELKLPYIQYSNESDFNFWVLRLCAQKEVTNLCLSPLARFDLREKCLPPPRSAGPRHALTNLRFDLTLTSCRQLIC